VQQSAKLPMNAELTERARGRRRTLEKLYNYPKEARAQLHKLQHQERSRSVVLRECKAVMQHMRSLAGKLLFRRDMYNDGLSHRSIEYSNKVSSRDSNCVCFYSCTTRERVRFQ
jgi:DNA repair ATPase RecN